jgi:hypothetical protein
MKITTKVSMSETLENSLAGRRILLIVASFFGYDKEIVSRLKARGASVAFYEDRPSTKTMSKVLNRLHPAFVQGAAKRHVERILYECRDMNFDDIVVIKGEAFTPILLKRLFSAFPKARTTFYMWDSFRNSRGAQAKLALFDRCLSFDPVDAAATKGVVLRPLFFVPSYIQQSSLEQDIDILFVGTVHTDRYAILKKLALSFPTGTKPYYFLYFPARFIYYLRRAFDPTFWASKVEEFSFVPLNHKENSALYARARAILDIEREIQTGLTMRTFEVLASGKKLITTNPSIKNFELFNPANICLVDRRNPSIPSDFFNEPLVPIHPKVLYRYSLDGWIDDVFV